jgi:hypothetical protein
MRSVQAFPSLTFRQRMKYGSAMLFEVFDQLGPSVILMEISFGVPLVQEPSDAS